MNKKIFFGLGSTLIMTAAPIAVVVSCNDNSPSKPNVDIIKASQSKDVLLAFAKTQKLVDDKGQVSPTNWSEFIRQYESSEAVEAAGKESDAWMVNEFKLTKDSTGIKGWTITKEQAQKIALHVSEAKGLTQDQKTFLWFDLIGEEGFATLLTLL